MKKILRNIFLLSSLFPVKILAQGRDVGNTNTDLPNPFGSNKTLFDVVRNLTDFLLTASILIATLMIVYAAFRIVTAGGNSGQVEEAKKTILYVVIGLGVILLFEVIIAIIGQVVGVEVKF